MKSHAPPKPEPITPEEQSRRLRIIETLRSAVGGYHYESVACKARCSPSQARLSLDALNVVEQYISFANAKLWRLKQIAST